MPLNWIFREQEPLPGREEVAEALGVSPLVVDILASRGLGDQAGMDRFLSPLLKHLPQPDTIPGLREAAEVLAHGLGDGLPMAVWGDYDVDGVTASAVVIDFLARRGHDIEYFLPNRLVHGYGLNVKSVEELAERGIRLLLTVDCGITDHKPVARARELGMTVVVSDHHQPGETLPDADAVCNPVLADCACTGMAGVGVAFMLMGALNKLLPGDPIDIRPLLDLAAMGTVADVVPLTGANRILVKNGLLIIKDAGRPGVAALKEASGFDRFAELGAGNIAFGLAPRINAAGRLGDAHLALEMLLADDVHAARPLANKLDGMNADRRREEQDILDQAIAQAEEQLASDDPPLGLVLYGEGWHPGIIGIVASRVAERFYRPTLLMTAMAEGGGVSEVLKGSGRSIAEVNLHGALCEFADILEEFGGHRQAAGLSIRAELLEELRERFNAAVVAQAGPEPHTASLKIDRELGFGEIDFALLKNLDALKPFGMGNPEPVFASPPVRVKDHRIFGKDHVKLTLADEDAGVVLTAKAWRKARELSVDLKGKMMRFAFSPKIDTFTGVPRIELTIRDWSELKG